MPAGSSTGFFAASPHGHLPWRQAIDQATRLPEPQAVQALLAEALQAPSHTHATHTLALQLAAHARAAQAASGLGRAGLVQSLLQEYSLSSQEGVALMCLAEALLRIPDAATRDALIRDKITPGHWHNHLGHSPSLFVNAATWGLLLTGKLVATHSEQGLLASLGRLLARGGEPLVRHGVDQAMRLMGQQFVAGQTIAEALQRSQAQQARGYRHSFDMLGEAALTEADAQRYLQAYAQAIEAIGAASAGRGVFDGPGISIKLSAVHPRYSRSQQARVMAELYPRLLQLCQQACAQGIGLNIDAEESERLTLSLDLLEPLCFEPSLHGWPGLGFVVQAYQKRAPHVVNHLIDLARRSGRRLLVRLVKGAYWDSEIKRAQQEGQLDYPVYTRKAHTDLAYLVCARRLLAAPEQVFPQFATHNAHTVAAIVAMAGPGPYHPQQYEFQCLHGMGEALYDAVVSNMLGEPGRGDPGDTAMPRRRCRIYAPVGTHETLLAYLVRRLLENGANTSFVHQLADTTQPLEALVRDPLAQVQAWAAEEGQPGLPHPAIGLPGALYGPARPNSPGIDWTHEPSLQALQQAVQQVEPELAAVLCSPLVLGPADVPATVSGAVSRAVAAAPAWAAVPAAQRARILRDTANRLCADRPALLHLLVHEAGKTWPNALAEWREAVDFLRFHAAQIDPGEAFGQTPSVPWGPSHRPWGAVACISPWNFPLAIFMGQVSAALAAGNTVLAKPAEQTPRVAGRAVQHLHAAGVPLEALQLLPGDGAVGAALVADPRVMGVLFTGSTEVARLLQRALVGRVGPTGHAVPLVAETGGQNAMVVDSSALPEQVVQDVLTSAFDSAGQRCSALRVLCLQHEVADAVLHMLSGALAEWRVGDPADLATDMGPVIDAEALARLQAHVQRMRAQGWPVQQWPAPPATDTRHFFPPTVVEIPSLRVLSHEVFGPVLHVLRYHRAELPALLAQIKATGYDLTLGVHSRIGETINMVRAAGLAGNQYVNRNMVGAVVGVQPFGGEGLSGTGPKAGGPLYLLRWLSARPEAALAPWVLQAPEGDEPGTVRLACELPLRGPTGEANTYTLHPVARVLCLADTVADLMVQWRALKALGCQAVWAERWRAVWQQLPEADRQQVQLTAAWPDPQAVAALGVQRVLLHGDAAALVQAQQVLAAMPGPIVGVVHALPGQRRLPLERLVQEVSTSINTSAAGGNAALMALS